MDIVKYGKVLVPESMRSDWEILVKAHNSALTYKKPKRPSMKKVLTAKEDIASAIIALTGGVVGFAFFLVSEATWVTDNIEFGSNEIVAATSGAAMIFFGWNLFSIHLSDESLTHRISRLCRKAFGLSGEFTTSGRAYQRAATEYERSENKHVANLRKQSKKLKPILARLNSMDSRYSFDFSEKGLIVHENIEHTPLQAQLEHFIEKAKKQ